MSVIFKSKQSNTLTQGASEVDDTKVDERMAGLAARATA